MSFSGRVWFVFGPADANGLVDITDTENMTLFEKLPAALAYKISLEHNKAIDDLAEEIRAYLKKEGETALPPEEKRQGDQTALPPSR